MSDGGDDATAQSWFQPQLEQIFRSAVITQASWKKEMDISFGVINSFFFSN